MSQNLTTMELPVNAVIIVVIIVDAIPFIAHPLFLFGRRCNILIELQLQASSILQCLLF